MKRIQDFFKQVKDCGTRHWILLWIGISFVFMVIIHFLFKVVGPDWLQATWGSGDILTYTSTVALGLVAFWQNIKNQEIQNKKDERQLAIEHYGLFDFINWNAEFYLSSNSGQKRDGHIFSDGFNGNKAVWKLSSLCNMDRLKLTFSIRNIGNTPANNLVITDIFGRRIENTNVPTSNEGVNDKKYILCDGVGEIIIILDLEELSKQKKMVYNLSFWNPFGSHYQQSITITSSYTDSIIQINADCTLKIIEK